jgi:small subunit ribosomal protein S17
MAGKTFDGTVTSNKMTKTLVVSVTRKFSEKRIGKIVSSRKKFKVHSEDSTVGIGDFVRFVECKPISKEKKFRLLAVLKKSEVATPSTLDDVK